MHQETSQPGRRARLLTLGLWGGLSLSLTAAGWLVLGACGIAGPDGRPLLAFCSNADALPDRRSELATVLAQERVLEDRLDQLRLALAAAPHCPVAEARPSPPRSPVPERDQGTPVDVAEAPEVTEAIPEIDQGEPPNGTSVDDPAAIDPPVAEDIDPTVEELATPPEIDADPTPEIPTPPEPPIPPEVDQGLEGQDPANTDSETRPPEANAQQPDPEQADQDPNTPPTPPDIPTPPLGEEEDIPDEVLDNRDIADLEGCWSLASRYSIRSRETGQNFATQDWEMCFGADGSGSQTLVFENGLRCEGRVHAQFDEAGNLSVIDLGNVPCEGGRGIDQRITRCERRPDGNVDCTTRHTTPPEFPVPVRFERQSS